MKVLHAKLVNTAKEVSTEKCLLKENILNQRSNFHIKKQNSKIKPSSRRKDNTRIKVKKNTIESTKSKVQCLKRKIKLTYF